MTVRLYSNVEQLWSASSAAVIPAVKWLSEQLRAVPPPGPRRLSQSPAVLQRAGALGCKALVCG